MVELTDQNFNNQVIDSNKSIIVETTASWSGSSEIIEPIINRNIIKYGDIVEFGTIDLQKHLIIKNRYGIVNVPTLLFFKKGELIDMLSGTFSNSDLEEKILRHY